MAKCKVIKCQNPSTRPDGYCFACYEDLLRIEKHLKDFYKDNFEGEDE